MTTEPPIPVTLLPCPFCGSEAQLDEHEGLTASRHFTATVQCGQCEQVWGNQGWGKSRVEANGEAIERWNTRHPVPTDKSLIVALEAAADTIEEPGINFGGRVVPLEKAIGIVSQYMAESVQNVDTLTKRGQETAKNDHMGEGHVDTIGSVATSPATSENKDETPAGDCIKPACDKPGSIKQNANDLLQRREICDNAILAKLADEVRRFLYLWEEAEDVDWKAGADTIIYSMLRPYLRTTEPVSIDKGANAMRDELCEAIPSGRNDSFCDLANSTKRAWTDLAAKAIAKAWGLPYV